MEKEKEIQEQAVEELKTQVKIFTDNSGDFDKKGNLFSPEEQAKRDKARQSAGQKIIDSALKQKDLSTLDLLGLSKFASEFKNELSSKPIEVVLTFEKSLANLRAQTKQAFEGLDQKIPGKKELEGVTGQQLNSVEDIDKAAKDAAASLKTMQEQINAVGTGNTKISGLRNEIKGIVTESQAGSRNFARLLAPGDTNNASNSFKLLHGLQDDIAATSKKGNIGQEDLTRLLGQLKELNKIGGDGGLAIGGNAGFRADVDTLGQALLKIKEIKDAQAQLAANPASINLEGVEQEMDKIRDALSALSFDPIETGANALKYARWAMRSTSANQLPSATAATASNLERASLRRHERMAAACQAERPRLRAAGGGGGGAAKLRAVTQAKVCGEAASLVTSPMAARSDQTEFPHICLAGNRSTPRPRLQSSSLKSLR